MSFKNSALLLQYGITIITDPCVFKVSIEREREGKQRENRRIYLQAQESLEEKNSQHASFSVYVSALAVSEIAPYTLK